jgi:predicted nucleic acid binding AN1-type Zn finger protein
MTQQEFFQSFCGKDIFETPLTANGYTYATEEHVLIAAKNEDVRIQAKEGKESHASIILETNCNEPANIDWSKLDSIPLVDEVIDERCDECNGCGQVDYEYFASKTQRTYEIEDDCPICKGYGSLEKRTGKKVSKLFNIKYNGLFFNSKYFLKLKDLEEFVGEKATLVYLPAKANKITFKCGVYTLVIMPLNAPLEGCETIEL